MKSHVRLLGLVGLSTLMCTLQDVASVASAAQPTQQQQGSQTVNPAAYVLPPAPALPAGCAAPTKEQCADSAWYASNACAKDPQKAPVVQSYCTWTLQKSWVDTQATQRPTLFPTSPPSSPQPILTPGRRNDHGKGVDPGKSSRPADKRRFPGSKAGAQPRLGASSPSTLNFVPISMQAGGGSYGGLHASSVMPHVTAVDKQLKPQRGVRAPTPTMQQTFEQVASTVLLTKPQFVASPGAGVNSCEEYAYKRWGEWSDFSTAAKMLGTNYRQIYKIATSPGSAHYLNKTALHQSGRSELIPIQTSDGRDNPYWFPFNGPNPNAPGAAKLDLTTAAFPWWKAHPNDTTAWPANAFVSQRPYWLDDPRATTVGGKQLISDADKLKVQSLISGQWPQSSGPRQIQPKNDALPLSLHTEMKHLLDSKYGDPLDDELADIEKRTGSYQDLLAKANGLRSDLTCLSAADPCFRCSPNPTTGARNTPSSAQQAIANRISGAPVINPGDLGGMLEGGSIASRLRGLGTLSRIGAGMAGLYAGPQGGAIGGAKQKGAPPAYMALPRGPAADPVAQCKANLETQRVPVADAYYDVAQQLTRMLSNELTFGDRSCLANPGSDQGNLCDWSYAKFAAWFSTLFDPNVEQDFQQCRSQIDTAVAAIPAPKPTGNLFAAVLKTPVNQALAFPCTQRRDFTGSAPDTNWFFKINGGYAGRMCEAGIVNVSVEDQQAAIMDQLKDIHWKQGMLYDATVDDNTLGSQDSLGAFFHYDANWNMAAKGQPANGDPMQSCHFEGGGGTNIHTGIYFFGDQINMFDMTSQGTANASPVVTMHAQYLDIDTFKPVKFASLESQPVPAGKDYVFPLVDPPYSLGGIEYGFWIEIGPIPIHIVFGATAKAGLDYDFAGNAGENCANLKNPSNFKIVSRLDPWVRADAYADASIDVVVASAGIRLDLELLRLGLPIGVSVSTVGNTYKFKNGMSITIDMLSGKVTAYVEVGLGPLSVETDATLFSWDGFHNETSLWGLDKTLDEKVVRIAMASFIDPGKVKCVCTPGTTGTCCSNIQCNAGDCAAKAKTINGQKEVCDFSDATFHKMLSLPGATTEMQKCKYFVLP